MELKPENKGGPAAFLRKPSKITRTGEYSAQGRRNSRILWGIMVSVLLFCLLCFRPGVRVRAAEAEDQRKSLDGKIRNSAEMIDRIREGLRVHSAGITVSFDYGSDIFAELNDVIEEWMEAAQKETAASDEGDYIRYQLGGYTYTSTSEQRQGRWYYRVRIVPSYYTFLSEEEKVTEAVRKIRRSMFFWPWTSREKKIRKIYDYLCRNVHYDKVHRKNPYYHKRSTAYGALVQGTATCQGYCTAMYRLLREEGIPCRIVTGTAGDEELHAWLIAELDGLWYLLDPTWDAGQENYRYCLRGTDDFQTDDFSGTGQTGHSKNGSPKAGLSAEDSRKTDLSEADRSGGTGLIVHLPGPAFQTESFINDHPMAAQGR